MSTTSPLSHQLSGALEFYAQGSSKNGDSEILGMPSEVQKSLRKKIHDAGREILKNAYCFGEQSFLNDKTFGIMPTHYCREQALQSSFDWRDRSTIKNIVNVESKERKTFLNLTPEIKNGVFYKTWELIHEELNYDPLDDSPCMRKDHSPFIENDFTLFTVSSHLKIEILRNYAETFVFAPQLFSSSVPIEIREEFFQRLSVSDVLQMRGVCHYTKEMIDSSPILQRRIAHEYLLKMHSECHIPLKRLKYFLVDDQLSVEINSPLTLCKVNDSLSQAIPWINHLIIKNATELQLNILFTHLEKNPHLISLCLIDCSVDSNSQKHLQSLIDTKNPPIFYFGNLKPKCEFQLQWMSSNHVLQLDPTQAENFSLESFLGDESDVIALKELEKAVLDESSSNLEVLEAMDTLKPVIQSKIVASLWHSCVMDAENVCDSPSIIQRKTRAFIEKNAHHPGLIAATHKQLERSRALFRV